MKKLYMIFLSLLPLAYVCAQEMDPDCHLLFNPGKYNEEMRVYSWVGDSYEGVLNSSANGPVVDSVMKWRKEGGWGGFGAIFRDSTILVDLTKYKYMTLWIMPTEENTKFIKAEYINRYCMLNDKHRIGENRLNVELPPDQWSKVKFNLEEVFEYTDRSDTNNFHLSNVGIQPDGTNDDATWLGNYYYFGPVYLESEAGCDAASNQDKLILHKKEYFKYFDNTIYIMEPGISNLSVYSILGDKILELKNPTGNFSLSEVNKGVYIILADLHNNMTLTSKILVR